MLKKLTGASDDAGVRLMVFGKHPGWGDHMPDLGRVTDRLIAFKKTLYTDGIGGNINAGRWEEQEGRSLIPFEHSLVMFERPTTWIVTRLWASRDGTVAGRSHYPLVIAAECEGVPFDSLGNDVLSRINALGVACAATESADEVSGLVDQAHSALDQLFTAAHQNAGQPESVGGLARTAEAAGERGARTGLVRLIYRMERDIPEYRVNRGGTSLGRVTRRPSADCSYHLRVPRWASDASAALGLWAGFMRETLVRETPSWIITPSDHEWVDIILGAAPSDQMACLRLGRESFPLTTEIPYEIDAKFEQATAALIDQSKQSTATRSA